VRATQGHQETDTKPRIDVDLGKVWVITRWNSRWDCGAFLSRFVRLLDGLPSSILLRLLTGATIPVRFASGENQAEGQKASEALNAAL
jgi:hypothetical protein